MQMTPCSVERCGRLEVEHFVGTQRMERHGAQGGPVLRGTVDKGNARRNVTSKPQYDAGALPEHSYDVKRRVWRHGSAVGMPAHHT
jgi:hypothetical protein